MSLEIQNSMESQKQTESLVSEKALHDLLNDYHKVTEHPNSGITDPKVNEMLTALVVVCNDGRVAGIAQTKQQAGSIFRAECKPNT